MIESHKYVVLRKETAVSSIMPAMSASELLQQCKQLNYERKVFYEEMAEFEERKRQLAELECQLNKQVCQSDHPQAVLHVSDNYNTGFRCWPCCQCSVFCTINVTLLYIH